LLPQTLLLLLLLLLTSGVRRSGSMTSPVSEACVVLSAKAAHTSVTANAVLQRWNAAGAAAGALAAHSVGAPLL
jgi:hypothetical protein